MEEAFAVISFEVQDGKKKSFPTYYNLVTYTLNQPNQNFRHDCLKYALEIVMNLSNE